MASTAETFEAAWAHHQAGQWRQAEEAYRQLLRRDPGNGRVWFALAHLCQTRSRLAEAAAYFRQAIEIHPQDPQGPFSLGNVLLQDKKYDEAAEAFRRCLKLRPDHVEALTNLGYVLGEQGKTEEAHAAYRRALAIRPDVPEVHHNLGNLLREQGKREEALACYDEALRLRPGYAKAYVNRGVCLIGLARLDEAVRDLRRGVELDPKFAEAHSSLGAALSVQGDLDGALAEYEESIRLNPNYAEAHWNRSLVWLLRGDFARGWEAYAWRWRQERGVDRLEPLDRPAWDGLPLDGKTILLRSEQGLGDTLQFIRYAPVLRGMGARVLVQPQNVLLPLLSRCPGIDQLVAHGAPLPPFDVHAPLLNLPFLLQTTLETVPADVPYLFADPALVERWRLELAPVRGFRVGIAWQGNPAHLWDRQRSVPLAAFEPLARVPGVRLLSLQKGTGTEQLAEVAGRFPVLALGGTLDGAAGAFMDTAAVLRNLDLLVTSDTAIAHLAGGLGVPVWVALSASPDWRWMLEREDSPWYPTMRLFRQKELGQWADIFGVMAAELARQVGHTAGARPLLIEVSPGEALDRLARLEARGASDEARAEREALAAACAGELRPSEELTRLAAELREVHRALAEAEEGMRRCEGENDFGPRYVELARSAARLRERRVGLRRAVNELLGWRPAAESTG
jgi:tetratricopeptide (TPR) repeat protein